MKPVLFVTNHAPAYRVGAFAALHEAEHVEFALVGGDLRHGGGGTATELPFPHRHVPQKDVQRLAASGDYRAVVAGLSGRVALPAAHRGARRARVPFVLWATIWRHPRTTAHALSYLPLRALYRDADAIATYGPHVSAYVQAKGARGPVVEAPQAVDTSFWSAPAAKPARQSEYQVMFVGRVNGEKGIGVLLSAWRASGLQVPQAALVLVGGGRFRAPSFATSAVLPVGAQPADEVRNFYAGSDVVVVPSIATRDFLEPWGLVVNEAFHQGTPVIASDAVGAAAGGLVRDGRNGLVVPAGDPDALAAALLRLREDAALRERLGAQARADVAPYTQAAWAAGVSRALAAVGVSLKRAVATVRHVMRLTVIVVALMALLVTPALASTRSKIIADCSDDGVLQGHYTASQLRDARKHLPSDVAEYTDCADVLRKAELPDTTSSTPGGVTPGTPGSAPGITVPGVGGGGGVPAVATPPVVPQSPQDNAALVGAQSAPEHPVSVAGADLLAGAAPLRQGYRANGLPTSLVIALILLGAAGAALSFPPIRRRLPFPRRRP